MKFMKTTGLALSVAMAALLAAGCASTPSSQNSKNIISEAGGVWVLSEIVTDGNIIAALPNQTLSVTNGENENSLTIAGCGGVNYYTMDLTFNGAEVAGSEGLVSTKMAGIDMESENIFFDALLTADRWDVEKGKSLVIYSELENIELRFKPLSLDGTEWIIYAVGDFPVYAEENNPSFVFGTDSVTVYTGLNTAILNYKFTPEYDICFEGAGPMTMVSGSEEEMDLESMILSSLADVRCYDIDGLNMDMTDAEGNRKFFMVRVK